MRQSNNKYNQNPLFIITHKYYILINTEAWAFLTEMILVFKIFNISAQKPFQYRSSGWRQWTVSLPSTTEEIYCGTVDFSWKGA